jgi:hypothetical protein
MVALAQDSTKRTGGTINVTSSFKPSLKPAAKINLSAAPPAAEPGRPTLSYNIPSQNLFFSYQPPPLKPLALEPDTMSAWANSNYIKLGYGNNQTPFAQGAFSFGDGQSSMIHIYGDYISSSGNDRAFQDYMNFNAGGQVLLYGVRNHEINIGGNFRSHETYLYGFPTQLPAYNKEVLRQRFTTISLRGGIKRSEATDYGIGYAPQLAVDFFSDNRNASENNIRFVLPFTKFFDKNFRFNLGITADLTTYNRSGVAAINNNFYSIDPSLEFNLNDNINVRAGASPSWDNGKFNLLPNIHVDVDMNGKAMQFQAGWLGYYRKNNYMRLAGLNPWINQPGFSNTQRSFELYGGIKGSIGSHFVYNAKASVLSHYNMALITNQFGSSDGKSFNAFSDPFVGAFAIHGELGYVNGEKFQLNSSLTATSFSSPDFYKAPVGLLPFEWNTNLRWQILKDFTLKIDGYIWDGPQWLDAANNIRKLNIVADLNTGFEFRVAKNINVWLQLNNILNSKYQRWNQYDVYGFNLLGGVVISLGK